MALSTFTVANTDHFVKGGVKSITLAEYSSATNFDTTGGSLASGYAQGGTAVVLAFDKETANMKVSSTSDKGLMMHTITLEGYVPNLIASTRAALESMRGKPLNAIVELYNSVSYLVGYDSELGTGDGSAGTTTLYPLSLTGIEYDSGTALVDAQGVTITFTAIQGQFPIPLA